MKTIRSLFIAALLGAAMTAHAAPILWLSTGGPDQLATVDVATGNTSVVGNTSVFLSDIAFSPTGDLYGISFSSLYKVDKTTAAVTLVGGLGGVSGTANALVFGADGTLYMAGNTLYTVNTSTGASTAIGGGIGFQSGGDLAFVAGSLYMATSGNDLVKIDTGTGAGALVGAMGAPSVFGLASPDNITLYGMGGQNVYEIDTSSGAATLVSTFLPALGFAAGSAFLTEAGAAAPEPATLALLGLGLAGLGFRRRGKA